MPSIIVSPPAVEPLDVATVRLHLRMVDDAEDDNVIAMITDAREAAETICRRAFITQQWKLALDEFPRPGMNISSANWYGPQWGTNPGPLSSARVEGRNGYEIYLPNPPLQTIDSVTYYDVSGVQQTLADGTDYIVDTVSEPARLVPAPNTTWPATQTRVNAVEVLFTCGYGLTANLVPSGIKRWMLMRIGAMYENREEVVIDSRITSVDLPFVDRLLDRYRVVTF